MWARLRRSASWGLQTGRPHVPAAERMPGNVWMVAEEPRAGIVFIRVAHQKGVDMGLLHWALIFLVVAIIAAIFGFAGIAAAAAGVAKILFFIFIVIFVILLLAHLFHHGPRAP